MELAFQRPSPGSPAHGRVRLPSIGDPSLLADTVAPLLSASMEEKQQLLETRDVVARLERLINLMNAGRANAVA
ncbi:LON peptidase substrate-binding domain-containing protein [Agrobacterium tumefaciens]|uniref:LON peptidase substrate-binding domain-containing protein n=1 Tax=Agrobacterium tumefaciens TaxID=358 RepID=UPI00307CEDF3